MNKILTETIGENIIVVGSGMLSIDPKGTELGTMAKIIELPEYKEMQVAQQEKSRAMQKSGQARGRCGAYLSLKGKAEVLKKEAESKKDDKLVAKYDLEIKKQAKLAADQDQEYKDQLGIASAKNTELLEITPRFSEKQMGIKRENPSFNQPNSGEYIDRGLSIVGCDDEGKQAFLNDDDLSDVLLAKGINVAGLMDLYLARGKNQQLLLSGEYIDDFRGCQYFYNDGKQWVESEVITDLGVNKNTVVVDEYQDSAIEREDLTPEELEEIRFQGLGAAEKQAEFEQKEIDLTAQSINMRNELEIKGDADALVKSQEFYQTSLAELKTKYGVK